MGCGIALGILIMIVGAMLFLLLVGPVFFGPVMMPGPVVEGAEGAPRDIPILSWMFRNRLLAAIGLVAGLVLLVIAVTVMKTLRSIKSETPPRAGWAPGDESTAVPEQQVTSDTVPSSEQATAPAAPQPPPLPTDAQEAAPEAQEEPPPDEGAGSWHKSPEHQAAYKTLALLWGQLSVGFVMTLVTTFIFSRIVDLPSFWYWVFFWFALWIVYFGAPRGSGYNVFAGAAVALLMAPIEFTVFAVRFIVASGQYKRLNGRWFKWELLPQFLGGRGVVYHGGKVSLGKDLLIFVVMSTILGVIVMAFLEPILLSLGHDPDDLETSALIWRADSERKGEKWAQAADLYGKAIDQGDLEDERLVKLLGWRAFCLHKKGDQDGAIAEATKAIELDPGEMFYHYCRGLAYRQKGDYTRAISDLSKCAAADPGKADYRAELAFARFFAGQFAAAAGDWEWAARCKGSSKAYWYVWAWVARSRAGQDGTPMLRACRRQMMPSGWPGPVIRMLLREITPAECLRAAANRNTQKQAEQQCEAHYFIAQAYLARGSIDEARKHLRQCVDTGCTEFYEYDAAKIDLRRVRN